MIKILRCKHCKHEWARRRGIDPKVCPRCKSKNWNKKPLVKYIPKTKKEKIEDKEHVYFGIKDELNQGINAIAVLKQRYLLKDENGNIIETPKDMFKRVANCVANGDKNLEEEFYNILINLEFLPNSPTLMNANAPLGQLAACFVLPINDSLGSIFSSLRDMSLIEQSGGGVGFSFSELRPKGDIVRSTKGVASGPVSFAKIFDTATEVIKSGGKRRGAMMGILDVTHPDIKKFITAKSEEGMLTNFNISIGVNDDFMNAVKNNKKYWLTNPRNNKRIIAVNAKNIFDLIAKNAWRNGDPGLVFLDEINKHNPTPELGKITATNPCSEEPLLPYESCILGSINLKNIARDGEINWNKLRGLVHLGVHFLDNCIDINKFPLKEIEIMTKQNRKIGLGVMGWADFLIRLKIPYDSDKALRLAERLIKFISDEARKKSIELGKEKGSFPNLKRSIWNGKFKLLRNANVTTVAPTGTISIIAGCSSGIEPLFAISFERDVLGTELIEVNKEFEKIAKERNFYSKRLMRKIVRKGSVKGIKEVPKDVQSIFVTAFDIKPEWHVKMQAAFQKYVDSGISKTVNLMKSASIEDVKKIFMLAYELRCKGITIYRYGSRKQQVLNIGKTIKVHHEYSGGCMYRRCLV